MVNLYCSVRSCWKSKERKHRFPNPKKYLNRLLKWVQLCGNPNFRGMPPEKIYANYRVCSLHFKPTDFGANNILLESAVPSRNLPKIASISTEFVNTEDVGIAGPSGVAKSDLASKQSNVPYSAVLEIAGPSRESEIEKRSISKEFAIIENTGLAGPSGFSKSDLLSKQCNVPHNLPEYSAVLEPAGPSRESEIGELSSQTQDVAVQTPRKNRGGMLREVNVSRKSDLTPKARNLYEKACSFQRKAMMSQKIRTSLKRKLKYERRLSTRIEKVTSSMDRIKARFFYSQVENELKSPKGRRYTLEDKVLALALYKQSGSSYRFLSKIFSLPSRKTIMRLLNRIPIRPGLHNEVFSVLKAEAKNFKNSADKICTLIFDEMSLEPSLQIKLNNGTVEGFEEFDDRNSEKVADHVQVFMLRGVRRKWKQPVFYNFVNGATKAADIVRIIKLIITKCQEIGLTVVSTICDQGSNNRSAINSLVQSNQQKYGKMGVQKNDFIFEVNGEEVILLYDVPHLFKGIRNNLLKYHLHFKCCNELKVAKWEDIEMAFKMDSFFGDLRMLPRITEQHVNPQKIRKMKVSTCTQVFSHSYAVAINVLSKSGMVAEGDEEILKMSPTGTDTASLLEFLDGLFDSLNGSTFTIQNGKTNRVAVRSGSPHLKLWDDALKVLQSFKFHQKGKFVVPPSVQT